MTDLYFQKPRTLEEILDYVHEEIDVKFTEFGHTTPKGLRKDMEPILRRDFSSAIEQYGLKSGDNVPVVRQASVPVQ